MLALSVPTFTEESLAWRYGATSWRDSHGFAQVVANSLSIGLNRRVTRSTEKRLLANRSGNLAGAFYLAAPAELWETTGAAVPSPAFAGTNAFRSGHVRPEFLAALSFPIDSR